MAEVVDQAAVGSPKKDQRNVVLYKPGSFDPALHFYPRVLNAQIHPLVRSFLSLGNERIAKRYIHLHPEASPPAVKKALGYSCRYFLWGGADLFSVTTEKGHKRFVVVETNSCPSGQKSMPMANEDAEHAGYRVLLERALLPTLQAGKINGVPLPEGVLAVLYDKNHMEASGYAAALAELTGEDVYLVPCFADDPDPCSRFRPDGVLEIRVSGAVTKREMVVEAAANGAKSGPRPAAAAAATAGKVHQVRRGGEEDTDLKLSPPQESESVIGQANGGQLTSETAPCDAAGVVVGHAEQNGKADDGEEWVTVRAALRYVTQRPWTRIPPVTRTLIFNPVLACLAGGRNKAVAAKAYDLHNAYLAPNGLSILTPETIWDVAKPEVPLWVGRMGGLAVVKVPYSNAGQGVWTITHDEELQEFMRIEHRYDRFIVQALIGNCSWSSLSTSGRLYHVGTIPSSKGNHIYASDLRVMVGSGPEGFFPVAIYARRARLPLSETLEKGSCSSWDMLGTNLSYKNEDGTWGTETERLLLMDSRDFNRLGVGVDDLIEAYMQTVLSVTAIDRLCCKLITPKGKFGLKLFQSLNPDPKLLGELYCPVLSPPMQPPEPPLRVIITCGKPEVDAEADVDTEDAKGDGKTECEDSLAAELQFEMRAAAPPVKRARY